MFGINVCLKLAVCLHLHVAKNRLALRCQESNINCGTKLFLHNFDFEHVCDKATTTDGSWTKDKILQEFVKEAKNKKLNCKVTEQMF